MKYSFFDIGNRIKSERKKTGMNQLHFIERLKDYGVFIGRNSLSDIENGKCADVLRLDFLTACCDIFACDMGFLLADPAYTCHTRELSEIQDTVGLSESAILALQNLNRNRARMPVAAEMVDTLNAILSSPADPMADFLQTVGNILGTCTYTASGGLVDDLPEMSTDDPAFIRVVQDKRLAMAIDNLKKSKK